MSDTDAQPESRDESVVLLREIIKHQKTTLKGLDVMLTVLISIKRGVGLIFWLIVIGIILGLIVGILA